MVLYYALLIALGFELSSLPFRAQKIVKLIMNIIGGGI